MTNETGRPGPTAGAVTEVHEPPVSGLAALRVERMPARDLWPEINQRLAPRRSAVRPWLLRGMAAAVVGFTAFGVWLAEGPMPAAPIASETAVALASPDQGASTPTLRDWQGFNVASGPSRALIKANLKIVTDAESQIRSAIDTDPGNEQLQHLLAATRRQQGELQSLLQTSI